MILRKDPDFDIDDPLDVFGIEIVRLMEHVDFQDPEFLKKDAERRQRMMDQFLESLENEFLEAYDKIWVDYCKRSGFPLPVPIRKELFEELYAKKLKVQKSIKRRFKEDIEGPDCFEWLQDAFFSQLRVTSGHAFDTAVENYPDKTIVEGRVPYLQTAFFTYSYIPKQRRKRSPDHDDCVPFDPSHKNLSDKLRYSCDDY